MSLRILTALVVAGFAAVAEPTVARGAARVEMEVALEPGFVSTELQAWHELLSAVGVDSLRLGGSANAARKLGVENVGSADAPSYRVYAVITARRELVLPHARFSRSDRGKLAQWIAELKNGGPPRKPGEKAPPFGLSAEQLDAVAQDLAKPVDFSTAGVPLRTVLIELGKRTSGPIVAEPSVAQQLGGAEKVPGELQGLACGTVAAAVLRREGWVFVPRLTAERKVEYYVTRSNLATDVWPIGWPPEKPLAEIVPEMFTLRNVEISDTPASQLMQVVAERLKLPMLFDEQALVARKLDPSKAMVKIPLAKLGYEAVLNHTMFQAGLKHEVRLDDAGKPFLWVTAR